MTPIKRAADEFGEAIEALIKATNAYRKAASLAYREGGRVVGTFGDAVAQGRPLEVATVVADLDGVVTLGARAQAAEKALDDATVRFGAAAADLVTHMKGA